MTSRLSLASALRLALVASAAALGMASPSLGGDELICPEMPSPGGAARPSRLEVGSLGVGSHVLPLGPARLDPGVYVVRLTQAGESFSARALVLR